MKRGSMRLLFAPLFRPENFLPLSIGALGAVISYDHIRRRAADIPELEPVQYLVPLLFDVLVAYAVYEFVRRTRAGKGAWFPGLATFLFLGASVIINVDYVSPRGLVEYLLALSAPIGAFFAWELWRSSRDFTSDVRTEAVEAFKEEELPELLDEAAARARADEAGLQAEKRAELKRQLLALEERTGRPELGAGSDSSPKPEPVSQPTVPSESAEEQTVRMIAEFKAEHPDAPRIDCRNHLMAELGITVSAVMRRMRKVGAWDDYDSWSREMADADA